MTEENDEFIETNIQLQTVEGETLAEATRIRLVVETEPERAYELFELVLTYVQLGGGFIASAQTDDGSPLDLGPKVIDAFSTGDDPVAE